MHDERTPPVSVAAIVEAYLSAADDAERSLHGATLALRFEPVIRRVWRLWLQQPGHYEYDDFFQDVFARLFAHLPALRTPAAFPGFFQRIARHVAIDALRKQQRYPERSTVEPDLLADTWHRSLWDAVVVRSYLELLPDGEREVLDLEFVEGLSPAEIMARTGLTRGGISSAKHRGIKRLQEMCRREAAEIERKAGEEKRGKKSS